MATFTSDRLEVSKPVVAPQSAGEVYVNQGMKVIPATHDAADIVKLCNLPADCMPVDFKLALEELDSNGTDTLTFSVGILNAAGDDLVSGTEFIVGAVSDADALHVPNSPNWLLGIDVSSSDRIVAMKITAAAATAAEGKAVGTLSYRASEWGV